MSFRIPTRWSQAARFAFFFLFIFSHAPAWTAPGGEERTLPDFDKRRPAEAVAVAPEKARAAGVLRARLPEARVEMDALSEAPKFIGSTREFLTGPAGEGRAVPAARLRARRAEEPHREVRAFLEEYRDLFGHGSEVLGAAQVKRDYTNAHNGLRSIVWQQQVDGVPVFGALLQAHLTRRGELVNVASHFLADPPAAATLGTPGRAALLAAPAISPAEAVAIAARNIGETVVAADVTPKDGPQGAEKKQSFRAAALRGATAQLAWLPLDKARARLCWQVVLTGGTSGEMFRILVDAATGEAQVRHCLTNYLSEATYRVFTGDSPTPMQPSLATPSTAQPAQVSRSLVTLSALDTTASPNGWIDDGVNETRGNNVDAHLDLNADDAADLPRPQGSPMRVFDFSLDLGQAPSTYRNAAVTQLFYWCNWMHDKLYALGFNEAAGNFQGDNFGRGGNGNDAVQADAQDGIGTNNANFSSPPDGSPGRMQMFVFDGPATDRDGDLDASIVLHEYTHGLSNRLVGGGVGINALASMGMGEGWSDFYALALLSKPGDDPQANHIVGGYATLQFLGLTENYYYGIRRYPYSTDLTKNPLTFKDTDPTQASAHAGVPRSPVIGSTANEIHNSGEVWCVTLWEARANLIAKYGFAGNQILLQLVTDGMKLSPTNPNFLQARDAILQADLVNNAGANAGELWAAFAKRGMGASASAPVSTTTVGLVEAFDLPDDLRVTPNVGFTSNGPVGGPFLNNSGVFTLTNTGSAALTWTATKSAGWLTLSATAGTLAAGASTTVTAALDASATSLGTAVLSDAVTFTNTTNGRFQTRAVSLFVGQPDYFTELFDTSPNDTANKTFTFTPNGSDSFYAVTRQPATAFPSDTTTGAATVTLADDASAIALVTGGESVKFYGTAYTSFFIGSNGFITFGSGDIEWVETFAAHFLKPRIAALFRDLNPATGGTIRRRQFSDHVAVTWQGIHEYGLLSSNNFQIEMFFDGRIRITILAIAATKGLIGLSRGQGLPAGFVESDFSAYPLPPPTLGVTLPTLAAEGAGVLANQGSVTLNLAAVAALAVNLVSSDPAAVSVPATVVVPAGQLSATFSPTILDDTKITGTHAVTVTASAAGWVAGGKSINITDNENTNLVLTLANVVEGGTATGSVAISGTLPTDLTVTLASGNAARVTVPATVTIPAGQTSAAFTETGVENALTDGAASLNVTASATGFTTAFAPLTVADNDVHHFTLSAVGGTQVRGVAFTVTITAVDVNGVALATFGGPVNLSASGGVTLTPATAVLAGGTATVAVTAGVFGSGVTLGASDGGGHTGTSNPFEVTYGVLHHFAWGAVGTTQVIGAPFAVALTAQDIAGNTVANFVGTAALNAGTATDRTVPLSPATTGSFSAGLWSGNVAVGQVIDAITLRAASGVAGGESGVFNVLGIPVLSVTPATAQMASGPFGGPVAGRQYALTNTGTGSLAWSLGKNADWLALPATSGVIAQGASATVTVGILPAGLEPGSYTGSVDFTNVSNGLGNTSRAATLTIVLPPPVPTALPAFSGGTSCTVAWSVVAGAQWYEAQCSSDPSFATPLDSGLIATTGYTFTGLGDGPHFYRVRARRVSSAGVFESVWSPTFASQQSATGPAIIVTSPRLTQQEVFTIEGLAFDPSGLASVTVNGTPVSSGDGFAHWSLANVALAPGNNVFVIEALNTAFAAAGSNITWNVYRATLTVDFDHDGLPDAWEDLAGLDLFDAAGVNGSLGDLSGNGVPNLLKYAFHLDPLSADLAGLPTATVETDPANQARYFTLRYRRLLAPGPLQYHVEVSHDLLDWTTTAADFLELANPVPNPDGLTETVAVRVLPALGTAGGFSREVRVRIAVP